MSKVFGYALLLSLVGAVLISLFILAVQWINSSNDNAQLTPTAKPSVVVHYYAALPPDYNLVDARTLG